MDEDQAIYVDVKRHYDKLMHIHKDKLDYIEKLKKKLKALNDELKTKNAELEKYEKLNQKFGFTDIESIEQFISEKMP